MGKFEYNIKENEKFGGKEIYITNKNTERKQKSNIVLKLCLGAIIGFVNGFWGGGGGMICVPLLIQGIKLPEKKAHATTLLIMLPLSIASLILYIMKGVMPWIDAGYIGGGFVVGGLLGAVFLKFISNMWLSIVFALIIIVGGIKLLI